ncbi:PEPxxWA-CTERM sorting domain-containing protein [Phenylobacterium sp.]|uniref:PEPxxWA-CTERM sorting domain-containing protein n=1 Tax=Phenylobacterium sp. TaxID=1871053 RepID=UPI00374D1EA8
MRLHLAFAVAAVAGALASPASALTPLSGSAQVQSQAFVNFLATTDTHMDAGNWVSAPQDLFVFAHAEASYQGPAIGVSSASAVGGNVARWGADGKSGSVDLEWRWNFGQIGGDGDPDPMLKGAAFDGLNPNWSYTFRADGDGLFRWEGQVRPDTAVPPNTVGVPANTPFGLSSWNLQLNGVTVIDLFDVTGAGPRTGDRDFALVAGQTYTFSLVNNSNIAGSNFGRAYRGAMLGDFFWDIVEAPAAPIPEPGTWALMIAGFGLAGTGLRRRRATALTPPRPTATARG